MPALAEPAATDTRYNLLLRLARESVDQAGGIIRGVTVAKAGVRAEGKVVMLDAAGNRTLDEELAVKKLPVFTDQKTLTTLLAAAKVTGPRVKAREDHNDSLGARLGYAFEYRMGEKGDLVAADLCVYEAYKNRDILFETILKTPDQIGISIDFEPEFEFTADRALMRVKKLEAIDVVDAGAITPDGLLLSAHEEALRVDNQKRAQAEKPANESQPTPTMAEPTLSDVLTACKGMTDGYAALGKQVEALSTQVGEHGKKLSSIPSAAPADSDALKALKSELEKLAASTKANTELLTAQSKERAFLKLGVTHTDRVQLAGKSIDELEKLAADKKNYLQLVDDRTATDKCSRSDAHSRVQRTDEGSIAFRAHQKARGIFDPNKVVQHAA